MTIKRYKKKPIIIEAMQLFKNNIESINKFMGKENILVDNKFIIQTLEGDMIAYEGDYIIKGVQGEFYPCRKDIFEQTYEEVEE